MFDATRKDRSIPKVEKFVQSDIQYADTLLNQGLTRKTQFQSWASNVFALWPS